MHFSHPLWLKNPGLCNAICLLNRYKVGCFKWAASIAASIADVWIQSMMEQLDTHVHIDVRTVSHAVMMNSACLSQVAP